MKQTVHASWSPICVYSQEHHTVQVYSTPESGIGCKQKQINRETKCMMFKHMLCHACMQWIKLWATWFSEHEVPSDSVYIFSALLASCNYTACLLVEPRGTADQRTNLHGCMTPPVQGEVIPVRTYWSAMQTVNPRHIGEEGGFTTFRKLIPLFCIYKLLWFFSWLNFFNKFDQIYIKS